MKVQISDKEQSRIKSAKTYYEKQGLEVTVENLEIGDYIFTNGNNSVAFEFKTIADFINSINDNRVFNEAINQAETFNHHFVIIHGDEHTRTKELAISKHFRPVTIYQYIGAISSLNRYTTVIESYSPYIDEAYFRMMKQAHKCLQNKPIVKKFPKKDKNVCFNWLAYCNYGINAKKASIIVNTLNLKTLTDLQKLTMEDLTQIKGIGEHTAQKIMEGLK